MIIPVSQANPDDLLIFHTMRETALAHYYEPEPGLFIAESAKVTLRAYEAGYKPVAMLVDEKMLDGEAAALLPALPGIPVYVADAQPFRELVGYPMTRGVLCAFLRRPLPSVEMLLSAFPGRSRIAVLDEVNNPTNVGSIFRNAAGLGLDAVILTKGASDPLYRRAIRVSMGTVLQMPWTKLGRFSGPSTRLIDELHGLGYKVAAMALSDESIPIDDPGLLAQEKLAVMLGNEDAGLCPESIKACDHCVKIPMAHGVDSLNVAAASAVAFWAVGKH